MPERFKVVCIPCKTLYKQRLYVFALLLLLSGKTSPSIDMYSLSMTGMYCDKTAEARITRFHIKVAKCLQFYQDGCDGETRRGRKSSIGHSNKCRVVFDVFRKAIRRKRWKLEESISTNRKSLYRLPICSEVDHLERP